MSRILIVILTLLSVFIWLRHVLIKGRSNDTSVREHQAPNKSTQNGESMVVCAHCGVHLPISESMRSASDERYFCCEEHLRLQNKDQA